MVLAAGLGTRMRPLTDRLPKPLVPVAGKPLIDHVLDRLADAGVERAVVNVHYMAEQIEQHLAYRTRPQIVISDERGLLLGTGGGVVRGACPSWARRRSSISIPTPSGSTACSPTSRASPRPSIPTRWTRCSCSRPPPAASAMPGAAISPWPRTAACARRPSARWRPSCMPGRQFFRRRCLPDAPSGRISAHDAIRSRRRGRPAAWPAAGGAVDARRHPGSHRRGGKRDPRKRELIGRTH